MIKIQLKIGYMKPLVGSGKINRRVDVRKIHKKKIFDATKLQKRMEIKRKVKLKKIDFRNDRTKAIFLYWNTKGKPFTTHKLVEGVIVSLGISKAYNIGKKYSFKDIREVIDLCHNTFTSPWFKFRTDKVGIGRLTLSDFFKYSKSKKDEIRKYHKELANANITSWFKECLKGEDYLRGTYSLRFKDKNKRLTRSLRKVWSTYSQDKLSPNDKNALTVCSRRAVKFAQLNESLGISPEGIVLTIDNMINKFHSFKPKHIGYLLTDHFWMKEIPYELVRYGTVTDIDKSKIQLLPQDNKK